uniref:Tenascin N n=1 Tax=Leptobrachium leishanense TaxID=445787 RepID=A0A8C5WC07_9ANUR
MENAFGKCVDGKCQCAEGFTGDDCSVKLCVPDCGPNGKCVNGKCVCSKGYTGVGCRERQCTPDCGRFGKCIDGTCQCAEGYTGPTCRKKKCPVDCGENGRCVDGSCLCAEGFTGPACKERKCAVDCRPNGRCVDGKCACKEGFTGDSCSVDIAGLCSGNGKYQVSTGTCVCNAGWEGPDCSQRSCPNNCANNGVCVNGVCRCASGFQGLDCSEEICDPECGENGKCVGGKCQCAVGFTGLTCIEEDCLVNCGDNGRCDGGQCFCEEGFYGESCSDLMAAESLGLVSTTENSLKISWELLLDVDHYILNYYPFGDESQKKQIQVSENQDGYLILGLTPGTLYQIMLYQIKNGVTSQPAELQARTADASLGTLWVTEEFEDSLEVEWENPRNKVDYFKLSYASQGGGDETALMVTQSSDVKTRYLITGLKPNTKYDINVQAVRGLVEGPASTVVGATAFDGPKNLRTTRVGEDTVSLAWEKTKGSIDKYMLSYTSADGATSEVAVGKAKDSTTVNNLIPGMEYKFQLWAEKGNARSKRASTTATTDIDAPKNLQASTVTESEYSLTWNPPIAQIDGYILTYEDADGQRQEVRLDATSKSFALKGLKLGYKYNVYLIAYKGERRSKQASTIFYTEIDPPTNLQSSEITQSEASLTWTPPTAKIDGYILTYEDASGSRKDILENERNLNVSFLEIKLDAGSTSYRLTGLKKGLKYNVYLVAYRGDRRSKQAITFFSTVAVVITHPLDCNQVRSSGFGKSGVYTIYPGGDKGKAIRAYCDMETDGGGWTVIQRRTSGKLDFYQKWRTYGEGFGDPSDEYWLGLEYINLLTTSVPYELRVDLRAGNESAYAVYRTFSVGSSRDKYKLTVGDYSGTAGDALQYHNGLKFSTSDRDNDLAITNCALSHRGAFWYKNCHLANPNGQYGNLAHSQGVNWEPWKGHEFSIPFIEMKMRPLAATERNV